MSCPALAPRIGRAQTRLEALYFLLAADEQALEQRARGAWARTLGEALPLAEVERRWLALGSRARKTLRERTLEILRGMAGVVHPPRAPAGALVVIRGGLAPRSPVGTRSPRGGLLRGASD